MSPSAPRPYHPEKCDPPKAFDVELNQIEVFRAGGRRDALWEYLEKLEKENDLRNQLDITTRRD